MANLSKSSKTVLIASAFILCSVVIALTKLRKLSQYERSLGVVESQGISLGVIRKSKSIVHVVFKDKNQQEHRFKFATRGLSSFTQGEPVSVAYNPANPNEAEITNTWYFWRMPLAIFVLGAIFLGSALKGNAEDQV